MSGNGIAELFAAYLNDTFIQVLKAVATLCWLLEKVAAGCMRFLTEENLWELFLAGTLTTLKESMPGILGSVVFGGSGGAGVLYLALMLAGVLLIIPALSSSRLVEPGRVLVWGVILGTLFVSSAWGYDLVSYLEHLRQSMATALVTGMGGAESSLDRLVATPMYATDAETQDYSFTLPGEFEDHYFDTPEFEGDYEAYELVIGVWPVQHVWTLWVESTASQTARRAEAQTGLAVAALTLVPAIVLFLFGLIYAALAAAALVLVIFFIVALPVGFFEFGATILVGIVRQYFYLFAITLLTVTLMALLVASNQLTIDVAAPEQAPNGLMTKIPILLIVTLALSYVSSMATGAMTDSFSVVSGSVRASFAGMNSGGRMPAGSGMLSDVAQAAMNVTGAAAMAGMTGGVGMALTAGGGAMLGNLSESGGRAAATLVQGNAPDNPYAQVFGTAARNNRRSGVAGMASAGSSSARATRTMKQRRAGLETRAGRTFDQASHTPKDSDDREFPWQGVDEGTFQVADSDLVEQGVREFREGNRVTARRTFTRAYGSREVAEQVTSRLETDPLQAHLPVAEMTDQVRRSAHQTVKAGKTLFDKRGNFTPEFRHTLWQNVRSDPALKHLDLKDTAQVQFLGTLAGASVRPLNPLWRDPHATRKLAHTILDPETPQIATGDQAALLSLQGLAHIEGWTPPQVEALFEATRSGQIGPSGDRVGSVVKEIFTHKELQRLDHATAKEAARLALLVTGQGQSIGAFARATPVPPPTPPRPHGDTATDAAQGSPVPARFPGRTRRGDPSGYGTATSPARGLAPEEEDAMIRALQRGIRENPTPPTPLDDEP